MGVADCPVCSGEIIRKEADLLCSVCGYIVNSPLFDKPDSHFEVAPEKVKKLMDDKRRFVLVDVRDDEERAYDKISGSVHIKLKDLAKNWFVLDKRDLIITYCHQGSKCLLAAKFLNQKGFTAKAIYGGIDNWSKTVDKNVKRYNKVVEHGKLKIICP